MFDWLTGRKACSPECVAKVAADCEAELARELAMFEEYLALPEKPMVRTWVRDTEASAPRLEDVIDLDQYSVWRAWRVKQ